MNKKKATSSKEKPPVPIMKRFIPIILISLLVASCSTRKQIVMFQDIEAVDGYEMYQEYEPRIEENDVLRIDVFSINPEVARPFNLHLNRDGGGGSSDMGSGSFSSGGGSSGGRNNDRMQGYLVSPEGTIQFPVLGSIEVKGLTRGKLEDQLTQEIRKYVRDAVVQVRIINFKFSIMGEVASTGVYQVSDERVTIPEALAMAGGITYGGKRDNVLVIRKEKGLISHGWVDLTQAEDIYKNPYFYLKQNDVVYVEPTYRQVKSAGFITSYTGLISLATTIISLTILITN